MKYGLGTVFLKGPRVYITILVSLRNLNDKSIRIFTKLTMCFCYALHSHLRIIYLGYLSRYIRIIGSTHQIVCKNCSHILYTHPDLKISGMCQIIPKFFIQKWGDLLHLCFSRCFLWTKSYSKIIIMSCPSPKYIYLGEKFFDLIRLEDVASSSAKSMYLMHNLSSLECADVHWKSSRIVLLKL